MKVNPINLKEIIRKASFNFRLDGANILFKRDKIFSLMISPDLTYAVQIETQNNVLSEIPDENGLELNFDLTNKQFSRRVFNQFSEEECVATFDMDYFVIEDGDASASFSLKTYEHVLRNDQLPPFSTDIETHVMIDDDLIKLCFKLCKSAYQAKFNDICFLVDKGKPYIGLADFSNKYTNEELIEIDGRISQTVRKKFWMDFNRVDFKEVMNLIKSSKDKEYSITFCYDKSQQSGYILIKSNDETERYILYSKRSNTTGDLVDINQLEQFEPPAIPESWNYGESVISVKKNLFKWKNLESETLNELWIARTILAKSPSEAASIMHGTLIPRMTWSQYCMDIRSSRQVVNRWLKRAFENETQIDSEQDQIEHDVTTQIVGDDQIVVVSADKNDHISNDFLNSIKNVVGDSDEKVIDAYDGRKAAEQIKSLVEGIEADSSKEAIVYVNNQYTYRDWFTPLFDGVLCFTNGNRKPGCFVYFGNHRDKFVSEFNKHGVVMARVQ